MSTPPSNEYVEIRDGRHYYVAGTRISLAVVIHDFWRGDSPEAILQAYPSIGSLARVYGAITFILEHPEAVESYLQDQDAQWKNFRADHPVPEKLCDRLRRSQEDLARRSS